MQPPCDILKAISQTSHNGMLALLSNTQHKLSDLRSKVKKPALTVSKCNISFKTWDTISLS